MRRARMEENVDSLIGSAFAPPRPQRPAVGAGGSSCANTERQRQRRSGKNLMGGIVAYPTERVVEEVVDREKAVGAAAVLSIEKGARIVLGEASYDRRHKRHSIIDDIQAGYGRVHEADA